MRINVTHLPGQENNWLPIWIATSPAEIALQRESRNIQREQRFFKKVEALKPKANYTKPDLSNSDEEYQQWKDGELSLHDARDYDCD